MTHELIRVLQGGVRSSGDAGSGIAFLRRDDMPVAWSVEPTADRREYFQFVYSSKSFICASFCTCSPIFEDKFPRVTLARFKECIVLGLLKCIAKQLPRGQCSYNLLSSAAHESVCRPHTHDPDHSSACVSQLDK